MAAEARAGRIVLDGCTVVTMDPGRTEYAVGHVVVDGSRIARVAPGRFVPTSTETDREVRVVDARGCVAVLVGGRPVVERDRLVTVEEEALATGLQAASTSLLHKASVLT